MKLSAPLLLAFALLAACGDDPAQPAQREDAITPSLQNHCLAFHEALCQRQIGCNVALDNHATSVDTCLQEARLLCEPRLLTWARSVELGLARFSADALAACRQELAQADCKALAVGRLPASCREVFQGDAAEGQECYTEVECQGALTCAAFGRCPGRCQAPDADPDDIGCELAGCPEDQFCDGRVCKSKVTVGEGCPNRDDACQEGLYCGKTAQSAALECRARLPEGERCFARGECVQGLSCLRAGEGGEERRCAAGLGQGAPCADADECAQGLICDGALGTCGAPAAEQEPCALTQDCEEGLYCWQEFDPAPGRGLCRERDKVGIGQGQPCNPATDRCRLGLYCRIGEQVEVGECALLPGLGEPCADFARNLNEECRQGACVNEGGELRCRLLGEEGAPCESNTWCLSLSCQEGACAPFDAVFCSP